MRTYTYILASSVPISSASALISSSSQRIDFTTQYSLQTNFGGPTPTGTVSLMVSNVNEVANFVPAASAFVSSSGSVLWNVISAGYEFIMVNFATSGTSSTGIMTSVLQSKGF